MIVDKTKQPYKSIFDNSYLIDQLTDIAEKFPSPSKFDLSNQNIGNSNYIVLALNEILLHFSHITEIILEGTRITKN